MDEKLSHGGPTQQHHLRTKCYLNPPVGAEDVRGDIQIHRDRLVTLKASYIFLEMTIITNSESMYRPFH
jgi:hypothetical protein